MSALTGNLHRLSSGDEFGVITEGLPSAGQIAASIAHEINNPLETVTNCLYLMDQAQMDETARSYLKLAERELNRIAHITASTLGFHRQSARLVKTDIHEMLENVLSLFEGRLTSNSITVIRRFDASSQISVFESEMQQVLGCIIANAIDAMLANQSGRLLIRTAFARERATGREGVFVTIADNGVGMDRHTSRDIFEPFFSTKSTPRTGLGLWVSRGILEKHGGSIRLRSRTGRRSGSTFRIFLPLRTTQAQRRMANVLPFPT